MWKALSGFSRVERSIYGLVLSLGSVSDHGCLTSGAPFVLFSGFLSGQRGGWMSGPAGVTGLHCKQTLEYGVMPNIEKSVEVGSFDV